MDDEINQVSNHAVFLCTRAAELFVRHLTEQAFLTDKARNASSSAGGTSGATAGGKNKKSIQYDDIARLVHRTDNLEFLCDVIPETTTYGKHKRDRRRRDDVLAEKKAKRATLAAGQTTLDMGGKGEVGEGMRAPDGEASDKAPSRPGTSAGAAPLDAMLNAEPANDPPPSRGVDRNEVTGLTRVQAPREREERRQRQLEQQMNPQPSHGPDAQLNGGRDIRFKHYEPRQNGTDARGDGDGDVQMDG